MFVHPFLLWGLLLAGVPVLIHLINMFRHQRVPWAAMEFLLVSQKRNRTWVILKQLLLLGARMTAVALVVLMLAQPRVSNELGSVLGGGRTHHVVLVDDSFSMSDRWDDSSAFDQAKEVVRRMAAEAERQVRPQVFTLLRFSRAGGTAKAAEPDLLREAVGSQFGKRIEEMLARIKVSHTAAGPTEALESILRLLGGSRDEERIVYMVSDFRARSWDDPKDLKGQLTRMVKLPAQLRLVNCVDAARPNLAITRLVPAEGTRAAGVPLFMEVAVANYGTSPAKDVSVLVEADGEVRPAVRIAEIPARQTVTERFPVLYAAAGQHRIAVRLDADAVAIDNARHYVLDLRAAVPVLLVDGDSRAADATYLSAALAPGGPVTTGITPRIEQPRFLSLNPLDQFRAIYLLDIERLDQSGIEALERYAAAGGGIGVFLGPRCRAAFFNNQLYRDGQGLFPVPLAGEAALLVDRLQRAPDLEVTEYPIFRVLAGTRNSFLSTVAVDRYFTVGDMPPNRASAVEIIARLRNGAPLAVARRFGKGRVVAFLTTAAPTWNNWARNNPSYVVVMLELQAFLSQSGQPDESPQVGSPLEVKLDPGRYAPQVRFSPPDEDAAPEIASDAVPGPDGTLCASLAMTDASGIYRARLARTDGTSEIRLFACNVDGQEGDLRALNGTELAGRLKGLPYEYQQAATFRAATEQLAGYNLGEALLYVLVALLIGEQLLAWSASCHPRGLRGVPARGGAK